MEFYFNKPAKGERAAYYLSLGQSDCLAEKLEAEAHPQLHIDFYGDGWLYPVHLISLRKIASGLDILSEFSEFLYKCISDDTSLYYVGD
jgi:hypothetical protein